jgi:hypothetical protein
MANVLIGGGLTPADVQAFSEALNRGPTASDHFRMLFDDVAKEELPLLEIAIERRPSSAIVSLHQPGEIVEMADGRKYEVQDNGQWHRVKD